jgi:hypothetical protein
MTFFSQARHLIRLCTILHAEGLDLSFIYIIKGKHFNKLLLCCLKENTIGQYNTNVAC